MWHKQSANIASKGFKMKSTTFPTTIRFRAPAGLAESLANAAAAEAKTASEFLRAAALDALHKRGIKPRLEVSHENRAA